MTAASLIVIAGPYIDRADNEDVAAVRAALLERGTEPILFDTTRPERSLTVGRGVPFPEVTAIWRSGPLLFVSPPSFTPEQARMTSASWKALVLGALEAFPGLLLDPHAVTVRAENKPLQLALAHAAGLDCPATVVTNEPSTVRAFAAEGKPLVMKLLAPPSVLRTNPLDTVVPMMWTQPLGVADLEDLEGLRACPMIFQERLDKARDVRVAFVGDRFFPASVDPNLVAEPHVDWRQDGAALRGKWQAHTLPAPVVAGLRTLQHDLGLRYGAFDLVLTRDGRHVFLEVNAFGVFSFLGPALAAPIADAVAELLCHG